MRVIETRLGQLEQKQVNEPRKAFATIGKAQ